MAIGDNTNSNLFGTNYNPEDEALLAAQNARIGAGNVPASAFGQAPAVAPFSLEAAGQVNPMMQPQSLEVTPQPQVTFRDYDAPEPPRASALSVFAPGGDLKPGIDVNAITPAPEMISPSAVNTALNQEVAVGPTSNEPGFLYNTFVKAPVRADQIATDFMSNLGDKISTGYDNLLGSAMRNLTPVEELGYTPEPFGKTFTDTFAITRPDGTKFYPDEVTTPGGTTQAPSGASALGATQGVTTPVETPTAGAQEQPEAVVSPFLQSPDTPSGLGGPLLRGFDMVNDAARGPNAPMGQDETRAALGGMTLNEYLNAPAGTPGVSGLRTDPQGRMIPNPAPAAVNNFAPQTSSVGGNFVPMPISEGNPIPMPGTRPGDLIRGPFRGDPAFSNGPATPPPAFSTRPSPLSPDGGFRVTGGNSVGVTQTPGSNLSPFEQASLERQQRIGGTGSFAGDSAAREARIDSRPDFNEVRRDSDRRGGKLSQADLRDLAQGQSPRATDGEKARALEIQQRAGLGAFEPEKELTELEKREIESRIRARDEEITKSERKTNFQPRLIDVGGEKAMELTPGYFQRIPKDTPKKTGLQKTIENLEADLKSGRLTQEEHDIAAKNATNLYIGRKDPSTKTGGATGAVSSIIDETIAAGGKEVAAPVPTSTSPAPVRINSQAEYDALPVGTPYIDSQGTETVKK